MQLRHFPLLSLLTAILHGMDQPAPSKDYIFSVSPAFLSNVSNGYTSPALRATANWKHEWAPWTGPATGFVKAAARGTWATRPEANTEPSFAEVQAGVAWQPEAQPFIPTKDPDFNPNAPGTDSPMPTGGWSAGRIELGARSRYETDQRQDNSDVANGLQLGYFHNKSTGPWPLIPSFTLDYQWVETLTSVQADLKETSYERVDACAAWSAPIGHIVADDTRWLAPLGVIFNLYGTLARQSSGEWREQADTKTRMIEVGLNYGLTDLNLWKCSSVYVTWSHGRRPPTTEDATVISVGLTVRLE